MSIEDQVKEYMVRESDYVDSATQLAENVAHEFGQDEWLDDETHWVWEMAATIYTASTFIDEYSPGIPTEILQ